MKAKDLSNQPTETYWMLRLLLAVLAFAFPLILWIGGHILGHLELAGSMSTYYHAVVPDTVVPGQGVMRNEFVGILFAVSALLLVYQGYSDLEDWALNLAALLAVGIAIFPMPWPVGSRDSWFSPHGMCAVSFFLCIAYVCIWRSKDTLPLIKDPAIRNRYYHTYTILGVLMVVVPLSAWVLSSLSPGRNVAKFCVELGGIYVFALYWVIKSLEAANTGVDDKAAKGKLRVKPHGVLDTFRVLPIEQVDMSKANR